jgi:DNA-binding LacI/PurR family transcriptional regulator
MAESAITLLLERVERRRDELVRVVLPFDLRIRESCGMRTPASEERGGT